MTIFPRRPGPGWKNMGSAVWEHMSGLRIHILGLARLPDGNTVSWRFDDEYDSKRQQGYNTKRALMVWSLSLIEPGKISSARPSNAQGSVHPFPEAVGAAG